MLYFFFYILDIYLNLALHYVFTVTCKLEVTEPEVIRTIPMGKTDFKAGEMVVIICSAKNQLFNKQETFTCTDNGKWDYKPTCKGKIVEKHFRIYC